MNCRYWATIVDLNAQATLLRHARYGRIDVVEGKLRAVYLRPWPKRASRVGIACWGALCHARRRGDRCRVWFNQPYRSRVFLAVAYAESNRDTTLASVLRAAEVVDAIAKIKQTDALLCEAANARISERFLMRYGWQRHCLNQPGRHFIKRFNWHESSTGLAAQFGKVVVATGFWEPAAEAQSGLAAGAGGY